MPATARALSANLTVVSPTDSGFVVLFPADSAAAPLVGLINFSQGQTRSNNAILSLARPVPQSSIPALRPALEELMALFCQEPPRIVERAFSTEEGCIEKGLYCHAR